jgi:hypothetical protein
MNNVEGVRNSDRDAYELRLITRAVVYLALLTGILYLRVAVVDGVAAIRDGQLPVAAILLLVFLIAGNLGLFISWRREAFGGALALLGGIGLAAIDYGVLGRDGWMAALLYSSPFIITGILCLACWWWSGDDRRLA